MNTIKFKIGDRVKYIGDMSTALIGKTGIIREVNYPADNIYVKWENSGSTRGVLPSNLQRYHIVPDELFEL